MTRPLSADGSRPRRRPAPDAAPGPLSRASRPPIWVEGRQAPAFAPGAFAEAGMLLAREAALHGLEALSARSDRLAAWLATADAARLAARLGRLLPPPERLSRPAALPGRWAGAAHRLLRDQPEAEPAAAARTAFPRPPAPRPTAAEPASPDPDIAAIRALMRHPARLEPAAIGPAPAAPLQAANPPFNQRAKVAAGRFRDWLAARVLAGTVLGFALPLGFGRALYRHLDGQDLREIAADCRQKHRP